jgi:hypothetical protein
MTTPSKRDVQRRIEKLEGDTEQRSVADVYADIVLAASSDDAEKAHDRLENAPAELLDDLVTGE